MTEKPLHVRVSEWQGDQVFEDNGRWFAEYGNDIREVAPLKAQARRLFRMTDRARYFTAGLLSGFALMLALSTAVWALR